MKKSYCIAIDGPSSSGKSTVAKGVAKELKFFHIDSGAIYRALAWWMEGHKGSLEGFSYRVEGASHFVGEREVTKEIRDPRISQKSSEIAVLPEVRQRANEIQREISCNKSIVIEGRDIGSVVCPNAEVKIFLTASGEERAKRRFQELTEKGIATTLEEVQKDLAKRDERDRTRKDAPLIQAKDAHVIDTTELSPQEVIQAIVALTKKEKGPPFLYRVVRGIFWAFLRLCYRIELRGAQNYPKGSLIIAPNHSSFLDPPAMGVVCPGEVHCVANVYLFKNPIFRWIFPRINVHPVAGEGGDLNTLKRMTGLLMAGKKVLVFPEGSRSSDNQLAPLKRGIAMLASIARCKVLPVWISGAYEVWPRGKKFPKLRGKIIVTFGVPLDWKDYENRGLAKKEGQALFIKDLEESIKDLGGKEPLR